MFRRRTFWNGLLTGGLLGALAALLLVPGIRAETRESLRERGTRLKEQAQRLWRRGKAEVADATERRH